MKILVYGSGAREHAIAWKLSKTKYPVKLYLANPNDGFKQLGEAIFETDFIKLAKISKEKGIDLLVVGPEMPLANGIVDQFELLGISCIGSNKYWSQLESSKSFAKNFMLKHKINTAKYVVVNNKEEIDTKLEEFSCLVNYKEREDSINKKIVIKADGLALGKGVFIVNNINEARLKILSLLNGEFKDASKKVIIEEFLQGVEISLISIYDGETLLPFIPAQDYKKLKDKNKGLNTGGMGAFCPIYLNDIQQEKINNYVKKLNKALNKEKANFKGFIYSGLILTNNNDIYVLEYNMRLGDPETQVLMMALESDLVDMLRFALDKNLKNLKLKWKAEQQYCVTIASEGYPLEYKKGYEIKNINYIKNLEDIEIFFAGVIEQNNKIFSNGGRILSICSNSIEKVYTACQMIQLENKFYRKDIGIVYNTY